MASSLFIFFKSGGHFGLVVTQESSSATSPLGVVRENVLCPKKVILLPFISNMSGLRTRIYGGTLTQSRNRVCRPSVLLPSLRGGGATVTRADHHSYRGLISVAIIFAHQMSDLASILGIKNGSGDRTIPSRHYSLHKIRLSALLLSKIRKDGVISRNESPHQDQVTIVIEVNANHVQAFRPIFFG